MLILPLFPDITGTVCNIILEKGEHENDEIYDTDGLHADTGGKL